MHVAIVALGPSSHDYTRAVEAAGGVRELFDEVWAINGYGTVFQCDRTFHMDDVRVQEVRAQGGNLKIANMLRALKSHPGPVYTSRPHPDYPGLIAYPLEDVINELKCHPYWNNTVAYAIAMAICGHAIGVLPQPVDRLSVFGADFTYPMQDVVEKGRGCCEFWVGLATGRGIEVHVPLSTSLMGACEGGQLYGYDTQKVTARFNGEGKIKLEFEDRPTPTAEQIEARYFKGQKQIAA